MRAFEVLRDDKRPGYEDPRVAQGAVFTDGSCAVRWLRARTWDTYESIGEMLLRLDAHIVQVGARVSNHHGGDKLTRIVFAPDPR